MILSLCLTLLATGLSSHSQLFRSKNLSACIISPHVGSMPSSSRDSDIHPDRIQAREDQYRRNVQARAPSPVAKRGVDMTELGSIGAHFDMFEYEPWPHSLELTDHAVLSANTSIHSPNNPASSTADGSPISRACTPTKCDAYLPEHEYEELQRQNSVNSKSPITFSDDIRLDRCYYATCVVSQSSC